MPNEYQWIWAFPIITAICLLIMAGILIHDRIKMALCPHDHTRTTLDGMICLNCRYTET